MTVRPTSSLSQHRVSPPNMSHPGTPSREPTAQPDSPELLPGFRKPRFTEAEPEDEEARELYEWTRDLNFDDVNRGIFPTSSGAQPEMTSRSVSFSSPLTKRVFAS